MTDGTPVPGPDEKDTIDRARRLAPYVAGILEMSPDAVIVVDESRRILAFSKGAEAAFGYREDEVIGREIEFLLPARFRPRHPEQVASFAEGPMTARHMRERGQIAGLRRDGTEFPAEASISKQEIAGGTALTVLLRDITERKTAERALQESDEQARALFEQAADAIVVISRDGTIGQANASAGVLLRCPPEEIEGRSFLDFLPAADRAAVAARARRVRPGELAAGDRQIVRADGTPVTVHLTQSALADGRVLVAFRDLTERLGAERALRESEELFRTTFESAPVGVSILDSEGKRVWANQALAAFFRCRPEELLGEQPEAATHPDDVRRERELMGAVTRGARDEYQLDKRYLLKDGSVAWGHLAVRAIRGSHGAPARYVAQLQDVTERTLAEQALRESEERARALFEQAADAIAVIRADGIIETANESVGRVLRMPAREVAGQHFLSFIPESERDLTLESFGAVAAGLNTEADQDLLRPDGSVVPVHLSATSLSDGRVLVAFRDQTERVAAERALRASEAEFRTTFEDAPSGISIMDASCKRIWVNKAFCTMMGYSREELLGGNFREVTDPDDLREELPITDALVRGERSRYQMEKRYIRKDGTPVWALVAGSAIRDEAGAVVRYVAHVQDISESRKAAEAIRRSEELFRTTFDSAPIGIALSAPDGKRMWVNQAFTNLLGYSREELLAATYREITHPADLAEDSRQLQRILDGEMDHYETEKRFIRKDHRIIWGYFTATLLRDEQGKPQHFVGQVQDITERKLAEEALRQSEARLRSVVTTAPVVLFALDDEGAFTFVAGHALDALGVRQESLVGSAIWDQPWMTAAMTEGVRQAIEGTPVNDVIALRDRFFDVQMTPTPRAGAILGATGVMLDVTERRSLETQLRRSQRLDSLGQLAGGIAHDFNNLLTVINGHSELLIDSLATGDPMRDEVRTILEAGQRGSALTRQLLTFSRRQVVQPRLMDLNEVVRNLEGMLRRLLGSRVELATDLEPGIEQVNADPGQIEQVVMNLVINARDAMADGGRVTVSTSRHEEGEAKVCLEVSDTGSGMSADVREHIFDPFFTTKEHGTGLGLATVHGIVTQAGGEIDVMSTPGGGTTFTIRLPAATGPPARSSGTSGGGGRR